MRRFLAVVCILVAGPVLCLRADLRPPDNSKLPKPPVPVKDMPALVVEVDDNAQEARLLVPRKWLGAVKAPDANGPRGEGVPVLPTIMAGLALTLAFVCGGLWLVRQRGQAHGGRLALLLVAGTVLVLGGSAAWADRAPPRRVPVVMGQLDRINLEVVEQGDLIKLIVNRGQLAKLNEAPKARPEPKK